MYVLLTTYPNKPRELKKFILGLVKSGLAACVQRVNYVKSYYMREGEMKQEEEKVLLIKCAKDHKEKIEKHFSANHPYEIPEMIWLHPEEVNDAYKAWVKNTGKKK